MSCCVCCPSGVGRLDWSMRTRPSVQIPWASGLLFPLLPSGATTFPLLIYVFPLFHHNLYLRLGPPEQRGEETEDG